jgi:phage virion morphogenesis protein
MAIVIQIDVDDSKVQAMLQRLIAFGSHPRKAMEDIATYGESSTRQRFADQAGPDGAAWLPSQRVQEKGGKTLIKDRHLLDSIVSSAGDNGAEWGSNLIYAAIHQFGGQAGRGRKVEIPPRPYLGINSEDEENILDIINGHLASAVDA